jgi:hypothetical protein
MELYLLVEASEETDKLRSQQLRIDGRVWTRVGPFSPEEASIPKFACVSYVWGATRVPNPLQVGAAISDQTLPALTAAIKSSSVPALWIDAFCIPTTQPARRATLESMGYIYSMAQEVIVALTPERSGALEEMLQSDLLPDRTLLAFESDDWVKSVWTYQEVVNSRTLQFTSVDPDSDAVVDGSTFLNRIGFSLDRYKKANNLNSFDLRARLPRLDAFEDLVADWRVSDYTDRSALQVMSNLDRRVALEPANYYHSMIGSLTQIPSARAAGAQIADLVQRVMVICEEKNDYSFIFTTTARDAGPGRFWRPRPEPLHSILPWFSFGSRQSGRHDSRGFWLENMVCLQAVDGADGPDATAMREVLQMLPIGMADFAGSPNDAFLALVPDLLARIGFSGSRHHVTTSSGAFYPQDVVQQDVEYDIVVATELFWMFGNPGFLKSKALRDPVCVPGVFVGIVDKTTASDYLLEES